MKLIFDQNLSRRLPAVLIDLYPESVHVRDVGLICAPDDEIWDYARTHGYTIATKDAGFVERAVLSGAPPKVIWMNTGNCPTRRVIELLRRNAIRLQEFIDDEDAAYINLR